MEQCGLSINIYITQTREGRNTREGEAASDGTDYYLNYSFARWRNSQNRRQAKQITLPDTFNKSKGTILEYTV